MKGIKFAVAWIAANDDPAAVLIDEVEAQTSVILVADLFGKSPREIARRVLAQRRGSTTTGRNRAITDPEKLERIRFYYFKTGLKISQSASRFEVSHTTIVNIIDNKGAYKDI